MTDETNDPVAKVESRRDGTSTKIFAISQWDDCQCEWVLKDVILCKSEAIKMASEGMAASVRCGRPMEWWRVEAHTIVTGGVGDVIWGCHCVSTESCV